MPFMNSRFFNIGPDSASPSSGPGWTCVTATEVYISDFSFVREMWSSHSEVQVVERAKCGYLHTLSTTTEHQFRDVLESLRCHGAVYA